MEIISRKEALVKGLKFYFTGKPCVNGHLCGRWVSTRNCPACTRINNRKWAARHPDLIRAKNARCYHADREHNRRRVEEWAEQNKDHFQKRRKDYREKNRDSRNAKAREWGRANLDKGRARQAKRKALKLQATPVWADLEAIAEIYAEAVRVSRETGTEWHVDHIVPLQGKNVCGLHVPWNLRVIPATENIAKGNKLIEEVATMRISQ